MKIVFAAIVALSLNAFADDLHIIHPSDLEKMMATQKNSTFVFDANNDATRVKEGVIPGAKMLTAPSNYAMNLLPSDKSANLVFYCANTMCMASHEAAQRALASGYKNVAVMTDGIQGWKQAGKKTTKFTR